VASDEWLVASDPESQVFESPDSNFEFQFPFSNFEFRFSADRLQPARARSKVREDCFDRRLRRKRRAQGRLKETTMTRPRARARGWKGALLLVGLGLAAAAPARAQLHETLPPGLGRADIAGTVHIEGVANRALRASVALETSQGAFVEEQSLSAGGVFHFTGLRRGRYTLTVTAGGYETYAQSIDLTNFFGSYVVNVTLTPRKSSGAPTTNAPSRTDMTAPKRAQKEWEKGAHALQDKKPDEARGHFEDAVSIYPCYARAQTELALTLMRQKDSAHSEAPLKKAIECDPDYVEAYLHLGWLLNAELRFAEGRRVLEEGVRRAPGDWRFYYYLAQSDTGLNNFPLAEQEFERTLSFATGVSPDVHETFASLYLKEKAYEKAYAEMQAYLKADPNGRYADKVRTVMHQLESAGLAGPPGTTGSS